MKKFYSLLIGFIAALGCMSAYAEDITWTLKCDYPGQITSISAMGNALTVDPTETEQTFTCAQYSYVSINFSAEYKCTSFTNAAGTPQGYVSTGSVSFTPDNNGVYILDLKSLEELRTASFTITVDDASRVRAMFSGTYADVPLHNGENLLKYDPTSEMHLQIQSTTSDPIFKVEKDGVSISDYYGSYSVDLTEGCNVNIITAFPDEDYTVTFTYSEGAEGFWQRAQIADVDVPDFDGQSLKVHAGKNLKLYANTGDYKLDYVSVNDVQETYFYSPLSKTVTGNMLIHVQGHKYGTVKFTLNVDDPDNVKFYNSNYTSNTALEGIVAGDNPLEFSENNAVLNLKPANGACSIVSVTDADGNDLYYNSYTGITVTEGMKIYVTTDAIDFDQQVILYIDDISAADYYFSAALAMPDYNRMDYNNLQSGYNTLAISADYHDVSLGFAKSSQTPSYVYRNGEALSPQYEGSTTFTFSAADKDVVKVYLLGEPAKVAVTFTGDAEADDAVVLRDHITPIAAWPGSTETVFAGTQYAISGENVADVKLDSTPVAKGEDGIYVVTVPADATTAEIDITKADGINSVSADAAQPDAEVYNLQGIRVGRASGLGTLPAGIYISGGRKVMVK